jgi:Ser/Thr protein kinase RdoA (MazF antagonist)
VMAGVLASVREHGFELGYRRAISDMIALLLLTAAEHRRDTPADPRLRAAVAEFVDRLDRELQRLSPVTNGEVSDGLGI